MEDNTTPAAAMAAVDPASFNPGDVVLDSLDAFAGVVVRILTSGAYPLSSMSVRDLLQSEKALNASTAKVRELLAAGDDEDLFRSSPTVHDTSAFLGRDEATDFGLSLLAHHDVVALKSTLNMNVDDIEGLEQALKSTSPVGIPDIEGLSEALEKHSKVKISDVEGLAAALKALKPARATSAAPQDPPLLSASPAEKPADAALDVAVED